MLKYIQSAIAILCVFSWNFWGQEAAVTGTVTDQDGMPMPGVTIEEKDTGNGTVTNFDGEFSLTLNDAQSSVLYFLIWGLKPRK